MYDIIGDVHGYAGLLKALLLKLGYTKTNGCYRHPSRKAVFLGDLINKGREVRKTLKIVRRMVENQAAFSVLGNNDYRAICYFTKSATGKFLLNHNSRTRNLFYFTTKSYTGKEEKLAEDILWLKTLPLFLELDDFRAVHACWDKKLVKFLKKSYPLQLMDDNFLEKSVLSGTDENQAIETLLSGKKIPIDQKVTVLNSHQKPISEIPVRWWLNPYGLYLKQIALGNYIFTENRILSRKEMKLFSEYPVHKKPLFLGHYCLRGSTGILQENICCVDFCCYRTGKLVAYRWNGEKLLDIKNIVSV
jgi:hypothetical protein